jgi:poly(3-hydroxyalkanoate) synthetase
MQNSGPVPRMAMEDLEAWGGGQLTVTITNPNAFRVGENLATRKGKVIFQNELM